MGPARGTARSPPARDANVEIASSQGARSPRECACTLSSTPGWAASGLGEVVSPTRDVVGLMSHLATADAFVRSVSSSASRSSPRRTGDGSSATSRTAPQRSGSRRPGTTRRAAASRCTASRPSQKTRRRTASSRCSAGEPARTGEAAPGGREHGLWSPLRGAAADVDRSRPGGLRRRFSPRPHRHGGARRRRAPQGRRDDLDGLLRRRARPRAARRHAGDAARRRSACRGARSRSPARSTTRSSPGSPRTRGAPSGRWSRREPRRRRPRALRRDGRGRGRRTRSDRSSECGSACARSSPRCAATSARSTRAPARGRSRSHSRRSSVRSSAVDLVPELLEAARAQRSAERRRSSTPISPRLPFESYSFDLACSRRTLHHVGRPELARRRAGARRRGPAAACSSTTRSRRRTRSKRSSSTASSGVATPRTTARSPTATCATSSTRTASCSSAASASRTVVELDYYLGLAGCTGEDAERVKDLSPGDREHYVAESAWYLCDEALTSAVDAATPRDQA